MSGGGGVVRVTAAVNGQFTGFYFGVGGVAPNPPLAGGKPLYGLATRTNTPVPLVAPSILIGFDLPPGGSTPFPFSIMRIQGGVIDSTFTSASALYDGSVNTFEWHITSQFIVGTQYTFTFT
jgi:hypothetical protein